jgi:ABC-type transporter lipoprotein component MlaA
MLKNILGRSILVISLLANVVVIGGNAPPSGEEPFDFAQTVVGNDPIEPVNRFLSGAENIFLRWVFRPIGYVYGSIMPRPVIKCFTNFTTNIAFPSPMLSSFIQGKFADGGIIFTRFMVNTVMTAGFFDPAEYWFNMTPVNEDFGQAFAYWGIGRGCYIGVPAMSGKWIRKISGKFLERTLRTSYNFLLCEPLPANPEAFNL